jgi:hypothetical protein
MFECFWMGFLMLEDCNVVVVYAFFFFLFVVCQQHFT